MKMKKIFLILMLGILTSCGFSPMYSNKKIDVYVAPISGTNGIDLRNELSAKFGGTNNQNARYKLNVILGKPITQYKAIQTKGDATWQEVKLIAKYTIFDGDKKIASSSETASESYTFVRYLVASNASYNNAVQNIITVLSEKISARVITETIKNK